MVERNKRRDRPGYEEEPENEFADPDDFSIQRDEDGTLLPQVVPTQLGKVEVIPLTYGDIERYFGDGDVADIDSEQLADLIDAHVIKPDLASHAGGRDTASYIQDMKPLAPRELLFAIMGASGLDVDVEMDDSGGATVEVGN